MDQNPRTIGSTDGANPIIKGQLQSDKLSSENVNLDFSEAILKTFN